MQAMTNLSIRRFSPVFFFAIASLSAGVVGGATTIHGLAPNSYGDAVSNGTPAPPKSGMTQDARSTSYDDCQGCSDQDRGYHWASLQNITSIADCPMDSWNFRRGCVAYMRDTGA